MLERLLVITMTGRRRSGSTSTPERTATRVPSSGTSRWAFSAFWSQIPLDIYNEIEFSRMKCLKLIAPPRSVQAPWYDERNRSEQTVNPPVACGSDVRVSVSAKPRVMTPQSSVNLPKTHLKTAQNSAKHYKKRVMRAVFALLTGCSDGLRSITNSTASKLPGASCRTPRSSTWTSTPASRASCRYATQPSPIPQNPHLVLLIITFPQNPHQILTCRSRQTSWACRTTIHAASPSRVDCPSTANSHAQRVPLFRW